MKLLIVLSVGSFLSCHVPVHCGAFSAVPLKVAFSRKLISTNFLK
jgi:hypothetical protein